MEFDKKEVKEILEKVLESYVRDVYFGLCSIAERELDILWEFKLFQAYLHSTLDENHVYYRFDDSITFDESQFVWKIRDTESRIKWLEEHIKLNS